MEGRATYFLGHDFFGQGSQSWTAIKDEVVFGASIHMYAGSIPSPVCPGAEIKFIGNKFPDLPFRAEFFSTSSH